MVQNKTRSLSKTFCLFVFHYNVPKLKMIDKSELLIKITLVVGCQ
jgi:hypothetical protein